ncbi:MAG TPA: hypothetical protein VNC39_07635 [Acidocella sp.]|uniref:hypothetical protein n=1 Tax=Acidocella sp. TaxID=50710 RepID=UPI002C67B6F5|nr:hypothetical protein [Acidocella sp.]HVE21830.1 hypothetical protein [Acidocella sp.]
MSESAIAASINLGLVQTASMLGVPHSWYRPQGAGPVVAAGNLRGTVMAYVTSTQNLQPQSAAWGKADRFAAFDAAGFLAGDYLVANETYFLAEIMPLASALRLALCNEVFAWSQMQRAAVGPGNRAGALMAVPQATGWPGWLQPSERRTAPDLHLPGDVDQPNAQILLPASLPGQIARGDQLTTGETQPVTWTVQSAVLSANGWQITAIHAGA